MKLYIAMFDNYRCISIRWQTLPVELRRSTMLEF